VQGAAAGILGATQHEPWLVYLGLTSLTIGFADFVWQQRNPLVVLYTSLIEIRSGLLTRPHRLSYTELAGWAHSARWLGFETIQAKRIYVPLQLLKKSERIRLGENPQSLKLGQPGFVALSRRDLEWRERKILGAVIPFATVTLMALFWLGFRGT
jgi:hypothetical protein